MGGGGGGGSGCLRCLRSIAGLRAAAAAQRLGRREELLAPGAAADLDGAALRGAAGGGVLLLLLGLRSNGEDGGDGEDGEDGGTGGGLADGLEELPLRPGEVAQLLEAGKGGCESAGALGAGHEGHKEGGLQAHGDRTLAELQSLLLQLRQVPLPLRGRPPPLSAASAGLGVRGVCSEALLEAETAEETPLLVVMDLDRSRRMQPLLHAHQSC